MRMEIKNPDDKAFVERKYNNEILFIFLVNCCRVSILVNNYVCYPNFFKWLRCLYGEVFLF